jgi:replicative superfamily II helicase
MTGRAGRLGYQEHGRGMIVSCYPGEIDGLLNQFIPPKQEHDHKNNQYSLTPTLLLKLFVLFQPNDADQFMKLIQQTLHFSKREVSTIGQESILLMIQNLLDDGFLTKQHNQLCMTRKAEITASQGITTKTAHEISRYVHNGAAEKKFNTTHMLFTTAMCSEISDVYIPVSMMEIKYHTWTRDFFHQYQRSQNTYTATHDPLPSPSALNKAHHQAAKKVMLCLDWMNGMPTMELENKYRVYSGFISRLTTEMAWLIHAMAYFVSANRMEQHETIDLQLTVKRLLYGLPADSLLWCEWMQNKIVNRQQTLQLIQHGFLCPSIIADRDQPLLRTILPDGIVQKLMKQFNSTQSEQDEIKALQMDDARPDRVLIDGKSVQLTKLQSKLLACLQKKVNRCVHYESIMNTLWGDGLGDRKGLNRLKNQITQKCVLAGGTSFQNIIEVVPGTGFILRVHLCK